MKLFLIIFLSSICSLCSQTFYSVDHSYQSDLKIHVVDYEYQADFKIFFVEQEYQSDLKVFFVKNKYQAKWNFNNKKHLLF